jgi:broad specificity phosphatase PhoE
MIIQGQVDNPLNETGLKQAHESGEFLKNETFDFVFSSSMSRAYKTAEIINEYTGYNGNIIVDDHFIERDFGSVCGKPIEGNYNLVMEGKIDDMETDQELVKRVSAGLDKLVNQYEGNKVMIACHSHVIKAALIHADSTNFTFRTKLANASTNIIEYKDGNYTVIDYNLSSHLTEK